MLLGDDFPHLRLELLEIFRGERLIDLEVVVESVFDRRTKTDFCVRSQPANGGSQNVRAGVPEHGE